MEDANGPSQADLQLILMRWRLTALATLSPEHRAEIQEAVRSVAGEAVFDRVMTSDTSAQRFVERFVRDRNDVSIVHKSRQMLGGTPDELKWQPKHGRILEKYRKGHKPPARLVRNTHAMRLSFSDGDHLVWR